MPPPAVSSPNERGVKGMWPQHTRTLPLSRVAFRFMPARRNNRDLQLELFRFSLPTAPSISQGIEDRQRNILAGFKYGVAGTRIRSTMDASDNLRGDKSCMTQVIQIQPSFLIRICAGSTLHLCVASR